MSQFFTAGGQRLELQLQPQSFQYIFDFQIYIEIYIYIYWLISQDWFPLGLTGLISLQSKGLQESSPAPQFNNINSLLLSFLHGPSLTSAHDYWRNHSLTRWTCQQGMVPLFNMLSRLVIAEGNGNPLQCSCLENPRDGGAWWAAVYGVAQSRTWLKWLSSSSSRLVIAFLQRCKHILISWLESPSTLTLVPMKIKSLSLSILYPSICHEAIGPHAMILVFWMLSFKPAFSLASFTFIKRLFSCSLSAINVVSSAYLKFFVFLLGNLIPACASSSLAFHMMYSAKKLNKQDDNIQPYILLSQLGTSPLFHAWF